MVIGRGNQSISELKLFVASEISVRENLARHLRARNLKETPSANNFCLHALYASNIHYAFTTITTESPLKNNLDTNLSFDTEFTTLPLPFLTLSVHNSFTFSNTILQWRSNAFTLATILWLFRHDITTGVLLSKAF